ncbi:uncharacterized protein HMPREF1541_06273 [Cyphellophora europaea CBS 101466]|uniref:Uncharacterized protein n=1 Tax=Cyphellophora europaea (strain CBS 101466) TaxID=1220924 RepID=W2RP41_CYPE1|nr:uncharacterized protein HMPREF1541_06273 [Cyphellophora europaea CBS 101466]ETN38242.1 hypothetical protein HMPREF1541_06273 [Cyphellophora europaea CBS 101466]
MASHQDDSAQLQTLLGQLTAAVGAYRPGPEPEAYAARMDITAKVKEMQRLMMAPADMALHHTVNMFELVGIRTLREYDVLRAIPAPPESISLADLAAKTGLQDSLLERIARLLVGTGFLDMTPDYQYRHTKFSSAYCQEPGPGNFMQAMFDEGLTPLTGFHSWLRTSGNDGQEPGDYYRNPYTSHHKQDGLSPLDIMAQFPKRLKEFQLGFMAQEDAVPITGYYDFGQLFDPEKDGDRPTVVDVGSGQGQSIKQMLDSFPNLESRRMVMEDLPPVIELAKTSKHVPSDVTMLVHNFLAPQPVAATGAKAYYLRRIMHDFSDANCVVILKHIRAAMLPDSRVLLADMVMPKRVTEADLPAAAIDNCMMIMGGKERTAEGFEKVVAEAGLELVRIWRSREDGATGALVEAKMSSS